MEGAASHCKREIDFLSVWPLVGQLYSSGGCTSKNKWAFCKLDLICLKPKRGHRLEWVGKGMDLGRVGQGDEYNKNCVKLSKNSLQEKERGIEGKKGWR